MDREVLTVSRGTEGLPQNSVPVEASVQSVESTDVLWAVASGVLDPSSGTEIALTGLWFVGGLGEAAPWDWGAVGPAEVEVWRSQIWGLSSVDSRLIIQQKPAL